MQQVRTWASGADDTLRQVLQVCPNCDIFNALVRPGRGRLQYTPRRSKRLRVQHDTVELRAFAALEMLLWFTGERHARLSSVQEIHSVRESSPITFTGAKETVRQIFQNRTRSLIYMQ